MIYPIVKDIEALKQISRPALPEDMNIAFDLLNTAKAHKEICAGLAAVQIGIPVRIIVVKQFDRYIVMVNPIILRKYGKRYTAEESCLSLEGTRKVKRHEAVDLTYSRPEAPDVRVRMAYSGLTAEIIQHECDHLDGILI